MPTWLEGVSKFKKVATTVLDVPQTKTLYSWSLEHECFINLCRILTTKVADNSANPVHMHKAISWCLEGRMSYTHFTQHRHTFVCWPWIWCLLPMRRKINHQLAQSWWNWRSDLKSLVFVSKPRIFSGSKQTGIWKTQYLFYFIWAPRHLPIPLW